MTDLAEHAILLEIRDNGATLVLLDLRQLTVHPADISKTRHWIAPKAIYLRGIPLHGLVVVDIEDHEAASATWAS